MILKNVRKLEMLENRKPIVNEKHLKRLIWHRKKDKIQNNLTQDQINVHYSL